MKFNVPSTGRKRFTLSKFTGGWKVPAKVTAASAAVTRRVPARKLLTAGLVLAIVSFFACVCIAIVVLESSAVCSTKDCAGWRFFSGDDATMKLSHELRKALMEANDANVNEGGAAAEYSFDELVKEVESEEDLKAIAFKIRAMLSQMERQVQSARKETVMWHLATHSVPGSLHCLSLKLAEEYAVNAMARSHLPPPEFASRLVDPAFLHLVLLTDNVIAASVAVNSTVQNSANPKKLVFHIVTDKKTYTPMHAWFATNPIESAILEVRGLHQYDWPQKVNSGVKEMLNTNHLIWRRYYNSYMANDSDYGQEHRGYLEALRPNSFSWLTHLRIYLPELFPGLNRVVLLDDDVVVQHDIYSLREVGLNRKVSGSVFQTWCEGDCCPGSKYADLLNFSHPLISSNFDGNKCAWVYGVNIFDLGAWRRTNITETYLRWLKLNVKSGLGFWNAGVLPPSLIAFEGQVHPIDSSWLVTDLGYRHRSEEISRDRLEAAAVVHFSGPVKPWLEVCSPEFRSLWSKYVNFSNKFVRSCSFMA